MRIYYPQSLDQVIRNFDNLFAEMKNNELQGLLGNQEPEPIIFSFQRK